MAKQCVQCGEKIGFFRKAVEKVYCSEQCADKAQKEMVEQQRQADALRDEAKQRVAEDAERDKAEQAEAARREEELRRCAKCDKQWDYTAAAEQGGVQTGKCTCGFEAEFVRIEDCPHCRSHSFVVAEDGSARCPRCKHKKG